MLLPDHGIRDAIAAGDLKITPYTEELIDADSYPLHLSDIVLQQRAGGIIDASAPDPDDFEPVEINPKEGFVLEPQHMVLWLTSEAVELSNGLAGDIDGRTTLARIGIMPVVASRHIKPGSKGRQTLEICNLGSRPVRLRPGLAVAKLTFQRLHNPVKDGYSGPYQSQKDGRPRG